MSSNKKKEKEKEKDEQKEKIIQIAVRFLKNPEISNKTEDAVNKYLKSKGLTDEDIKQARQQATEELQKEKEREQEKKSQQQAEIVGITQLNKSTLSAQEFNALFDQAAKTNALSLRDTQIYTINSKVFTLENLEILIVSFNRLAIIPDEIGKLKNLKRFHASGCYLTDNSISQELYKLVNIEELNLSRNNLYYQQEVTNLEKLVILDLSHNQILEIPEDINKLTQLRFLSYRDNNISRIPGGIKELKELRKLYLGQNVFDLREMENESNPQKVLSSIECFD